MVTDMSADDFETVYEDKYIATVEQLNKIALKAVKLVENELLAAGLTGKSHAVWTLVDFHRAAWQAKNFIL